MNLKDKAEKMERAQSVLEYAVLIVIIMAALIMMQVYLKRGIQGRIRNSAEDVGSGLTYSPKATLGSSVMDRAINEYSFSNVVWSDNNLNETSVTNSTYNMSQTTNRTEQTLPLADEPVRN